MRPLLRAKVLVLNNWTMKQKGTHMFVKIQATKSDKLSFARDIKLPKAASGSIFLQIFEDFIDANSLHVYTAHII